MMQTKYVIEVVQKSRPALAVYYGGQNKQNWPVFTLTKNAIKTYDFIEEADRDARLLQIIHKDDLNSVKVLKVQRRI